MPTSSSPKGRATTLLVNLQSGFDTAATGDYVSTLFYNETIAETEAKEEDPVLGLDRANHRDQTKQAPGLRTLSGGLTVPLDINHIGLWLYALFGAPVTTGTGPYTHVFSSGADQLPYLTMEFEKRTGAAFFQAIGLVASSLALSAGREAGYRQAELQFVGRSETVLSSSGAGTPEAQMSRVPALASVGKMLLDSVQVGALVNMSLNYANNPTAIDVINGTKYPDGYDLNDAATCSGDLTLRYSDESFYDKADADSAHLVEFLYQVSANEKISFAMPAVRFEKGGIAPISGPGGMQAQVNWSAEQTGSENMLTVTLTNSIESYFS